MRKYIALVLALACVLGLVGCSNSSIKGIDKATKIEVVQYDKSNGTEIGTVTLTEETDIKHIADNLNSLKLKKMENNDPTVLEYKLVFYNTSGETVETVSIPANDWVGYDGYFHSITSGELDRAYIAGLFNSTKSTHTLEVTENSVGEIGRETFNLSVEISEEDANSLSEIINGATWKEGTTDCTSDCVITIKGHMAYYHSDCGTFNKYNLAEMSAYSSRVQEVNGKSVVLSEKDKITVNTILQKYITLSVDNNSATLDIVEIRDREKEESIPCDTALEKFYEDESNEYYFSVIKSQYIVVTYNDGSSEDIVTALADGRVTMTDLDKFNIEYHIEPKGTN
ncbi:MAG: hypothetical protein IJA90_06900 [Peptococcaceae bacterium]|nr:hypothetical protein [Peptococcaceae bacterium]